MRRVFMLSTVVLLSLAACGHAAGLLQNADFATEPPEGGKMAPGWTVGEADAKLYTYVNDDGHSESHSIHFNTVEAATAGAVTQDFKCEKNTEYVLTAALKSDGTTRPVVQVIVPGTTITAVTLVSGDDKNWATFSARFNSGSADRLQVRIYGDRALAAGKAAAGSSAVDDVQIYVASEVPDEIKPNKLFTPPGPNIALDKPYSMSPAPNYGYCTDAEDKVQLTDGEYTVGYFWTQKTTVGWSNSVPVVITVDLGKVEPISGFSFNSAAGVASVSWPQGVAILVSDDGKEWTQAGNLVTMSAKYGIPPVDKYSIHRFVTDEVKTRGRYVTFMVDSSPYCFVDEVEIYRGPEELLAQAPEGRKVADAKQYFLESRVMAAVIWRLSSDLKLVTDALEDANIAAGRKKQLLADADLLAGQISATPEETPSDFTTILPLNDLHARIYALNAPVLKARGLRALTVWQAPRYEMLSPMEAPEKSPARPTLSVKMMRNERRAEVLNLTNAREEAVAVTLSIDGLPGGTNPDWVSVREVLFTDTKDRIPIAAALPEAEQIDGLWKVTIPAGCTRQVWFALDSADVEPGDYKGSIKWAAYPAEGMAPGMQPRLAAPPAVPLSVHVSAQKMPDEMTIAVGGWDYTNGEGSYDATPGNIPMLIATLREHGVNTPWGNAGVLPRGASFDAEGKITNPDEIDFSQWDQWIERWPDAKYYCVYWSVGGSFNGEKMGTPRFNMMVGEYVNAWMDHAEGKGVDPKTVAVLLVDEPHQDEQVQTIITWAKAVSAAQPDMIIWEDPTYRDPREASIEMFELVDVMSPNLPMFMSGVEAARQFYVDQQAQGRTLWFYSCSGPAKLLDPISYFRGQFWWAMKYDAKGSCYWAFADEAYSGSSWNAYKLTRSQYSPLFIDPTSVTDGKQMEAILEGAEDYEYFVMLGSRVEELKAKGVDTQAVKDAEKLLVDGPEQVVSGISASVLGWQSEADRTIMDALRVQMLDALEKLSKL